MWHWTIISGLECCEFTSVPFWQLEAVVNVERKNTEKLKYECDISLMDKGVVSVGIRKGNNPYIEK